MTDAGQAPSQVLSLPTGGGAIRGIGDTFTADPQSGAGSYRVPIATPARHRIGPDLALTYSVTGANGFAGHGWSFGQPWIGRRTSHGPPTYDDRRDVFVLGGTDELVVVGEAANGAVEYRTAVGGDHARIVFHPDAAGAGHWEVTDRGGVLRRFGTDPDGTAPAGVPTSVDCDPRAPERVVAWYLTETRDPLGNTVVHEYDLDTGEAPGHRWRTPLLRRIRYGDHPGDSGATEWFATVTFTDEARDDPFSTRVAGFEQRVTRRYSALTTAVHPGRDVPVRRYELRYETDAVSGMSRLAEVEAVDVDDDGHDHRRIPAVAFRYSGVDPAHRTFRPVGTVGQGPLAGPGTELVDVIGDGLPDSLECADLVRYRRNRGDGTFDPPRPMADAPTGARLGAPGVRLLDADGDGRADLSVPGPGGTPSAHVPLLFGGRWGRLRPEPTTGAPALGSPRVRLLDLDGDHVTDALESGSSLLCWFRRADGGWSPARPVRWSDGVTPDVDLGDPRVHLADMTGDGAKDLVATHSGAVTYWPNERNGRFGPPIRMSGGPDLPTDLDPSRLLLADVTGGGPADLVLVGSGRVTVWPNHSGNGWGAPIVVRGLPAADGTVQVADLFGLGAAGLVWTATSARPGVPATTFLDLCGGVRPGLLTAIDNRLGAVTTIDYVSSAALAARDRPTAARWRTPLPFPVALVSRVRTTDAVSGSTTTIAYDYRHGYWAPRRREFRGFARVDRTDAEHRDAGTVGSPPLRTTTWFHLGDVDLGDGPGPPPDLSDEHFTGDPALLDDPGGVAATVAAQPPADRPDAWRALRGRPLRSEVRALDGSRLATRPHSVTEYAYRLRREPSTGAPSWSAVEIARRSTSWERGDDPMTRLEFSEDHDPSGLPRRHTVVAPPRRSARRRPVALTSGRTAHPDPETVLATHTHTRYAEDDTGTGIRDRVATVTSTRLATPPRVDETRPDDVVAVLADQWRSARAVHDAFVRGEGVEITANVVHHYDGPAYVGRAPGVVGPYGLLTRTEILVHTDESLDRCFGDRRPEALGGTAPHPAGAPPLGDLGYRFSAGDDAHPAGWYADTLRHAHDVQVPGTPSDHGLVVGALDPLGHETTTSHDAYGVVAVSVRDPLGLETRTVPDYRAGGPAVAIEPNGTQTHTRYDPGGRPERVWRVGTDGRSGTADRPDVRYLYDLTAFRERGEPASVHTIRRVHHASDGQGGGWDDVLESWRYVDGSGRVVQERARSDEFDLGDDAGLLVDDPAGGPARAIPGEVGHSAVGQRDPERVVVSARQVLDDRGRVVESWEPFFASGAGYDPTPRGRPVRTTYDALGRIVLTEHPDGSRQRTVFGVPADLTDPDSVIPTPWETTAYDANDLAPASWAPDGASLADRVPPELHHTPTTTVSDGFGRVVLRLRRRSADPEGAHATETHHDPEGRVLAVVDELGREAARTVHDLTGRAAAATGIDTGRRLTILDAAGNLRLTHDARGARTVRTFDAAHRPRDLYGAETADGPVTLRERSTYGDDDPDPSAARSARRLGRLWTRLDGAGLVTVVGYDLDGAVVDQHRRVVTDDVLAAVDPGRSWTPDWSAVDPEDVLDARQDGTGTELDGLGRIVRTHAPADADGHRTVLTTTYDRSGAVRSVLSGDGTGTRWIVRDARGRRLLVASACGLVTRFAHDPVTGRLVRLRTEPATVDGDGWTATGPPVQDLTYTYDLTGTLTSIVECVAGCGVAGSAGGRDRLERRFVHDGLGRLVSATGRECATIPAPRPMADLARCGAFGTSPGAVPAATGPHNAPDLVREYLERFAHDPCGNLVDVHHTAVGGTAWHRSFGLGGSAPGGAAGTSNRLETVRAGASEDVLRHDEAGNLAARGDAHTYDWDHAGRLIGFRIHAGSGTSVRARYLYGSDGARVKKWVRRGGGPARDESTTYLGDLQERTTWAEGGGGGSTLVHVADDAGRVASVRSGAPRPRDATPAVRYDLRDHLGSTSVVVAGDGAAVGREEYFPFGETSFGGVARSRYRLGGRELDDESDLVQMGLRYYAPGLGRWTSVDPAGPVDTTSGYVYAACRPLVLTDPTGAINEIGGPPSGPSFADVDAFLQDVGVSKATEARLTDTRPAVDPVEGVDYDAARRRGTTQSRAVSEIASEGGRFQENHTRAVRHAKSVGLPEWALNEPGTFQSLDSRRSASASGSILDGGLAPERTLTHHNVVERMIDADFARAPQTPRGLMDAADTTRWRTPAVIDRAQRGSVSLEFSLGMLGTALTVYGLYRSGEHLMDAYRESESSGSSRPLARAAVHESGAWAGGFLGGFAAGALLGVETGPGLFVTGLIGGMIGAAGGSFTADAAFDAADDIGLWLAAGFDAMVRPSLSPSVYGPWG